MHVESIKVTSPYTSKNNTKRDVAVAGAGAGTAVVARELSTLSKFSKVAPNVIKTTAKKADKISNVFIRFTEFLRKAKLPKVAQFLETKAMTKSLGALGTVGAVAVTVAELFNTGTVLDKISRIASEQQ